MNIKASGRAALMVAATIWLWCAGPLQAQETTDTAQPATAQQAAAPNPLQQLFGIKPAAPAATEPPAAEPAGRPIVLNKYRKISARHDRRHQAARTQRHGRKVAAEDKDASEAKVEATRPAAVAGADNTVPMTATDAGARSPGTAAPRPASAIAEASDTAKTETGVVASDELNEVDRAMTTQETIQGITQAAAQAEPASTLALATLAPPEPVTTGQAATSDDTSSWARASLIGKIFIGFGGLLMLASVARMLMA